MINRPLRLNTHFIAGLEMNRFLFDTGATRAMRGGCHQEPAECLKKSISALWSGSNHRRCNKQPNIILASGEKEAAECADGAVVMVLASEDSPIISPINRSGFWRWLVQ